jgi:hypothetical protein
MSLSVLLVTAVLETAAAPVPRLMCNPKDNTARVLASPSPNATHPDWSGPDTVGTSLTFVADDGPLDGHKDPHSNPYLRGDLLSARGGVLNRGVYVLFKEWDCRFEPPLDAKDARP